MFKNQLAHDERYYKNSQSQYEIDTSRSVYEVYIELSRDKEGNVMKNKDGSDRYHAIDDLQLSKTDAEVLVKKIRDDYFKVIYEVNGDFVEKVEKDNRRIYYTVDKNKVTTIPAGTQVVRRGDFYKIPTEIGYVLVDDKIIEQPKVLAVRKFKTEDHKAEAEKICKGKKAQQEAED